MQDLKLPKFDKNRCVNQQKVLVFDSDNLKYDIILSTNLLSKTGFKSNYSEGNMEWFDYSIPLRPPGGLDSNKFDSMEDVFCIQVKNDLFGEGWLKYFATEILDAKYETTDVAEVMKGPTHLNAHQKADLLWVLQENKKMFDETLDIYPHKRLHINIDPNAKSVHSMPYPVPWIHLKTFNKELDHLIGLGLLAPQQESEWASSSFIIPNPKKDNTVGRISNSCQLNKVIRCKQYLLPIIMDILHMLSGYKFFVKLDVSMQYYTYQLDDKN